jgi:hypothetical protein
VLAGHLGSRERGEFGICAHVLRAGGRALECASTTSLPCPFRADNVLKHYIKPLDAYGGVISAASSGLNARSAPTWLSTTAPESFHLTASANLILEKVEHICT